MALWRLRVDVADEPGRLAAIAAAVRSVGGNVLGFEVHAKPDGGVTDELVVELAPPRNVGDLVARLHAAGADAVRAVPAQARQLVDLATSLVDAASRLVVEPQALPAVLAVASGADRVRVGDEDSLVAVPGGAVLALGGGRVAELSRGWAPFTATELARAAAVVRFATLLGAVPPQREWLVCLRGGSELTIRRPAREDRAVPDLCEGWEGFELAPSALVAVSDGDVVGVGQLFRYGIEPVAEIALLVAAAWRRRGVGTALTRRLVAEARADGVRRFVASASVDGLAQVLARAGLRLQGRRRGDAGELTAAVPVSVPSP